MMKQRVMSVRVRADEGKMNNLWRNRTEEEREDEKEILSTPFFPLFLCICAVCEFHQEKCAAWSFGVIKAPLCSMLCCSDEHKIRSSLVGAPLLLASVIKCHRQSQFLPLITITFDSTLDVSLV
ncbi:uncharacterized [Tachysurus ichikawai]